MTRWFTVPEICCATDGQMDGQKDGRMDGQDGGADGQDGQPEKVTYRGECST